MKFIIGQKQSMTQFFTEDGRAHAATIVSVSPAVITAIKTEEKDGYSAIQVGYGIRKEKNIAKPQKGHFGDLGNFMATQEFKMSSEALQEKKVGETIDLSAFAVDETIEVAGVTKGKGFQGVVKRHGFAGGRRTHGQKHSEREAGSIGAGGVQRVFKGLRMAGRMGGDRIKVKNLKVLAVHPDQNIMIIKGAVPGRRGTVLEIVAQ